MHFYALYQRDFCQDGEAFEDYPQAIALIEQSFAKHKLIRCSIHWYKFAKKRKKYKNKEIDRESMARGEHVLSKKLY